MAALPRKTPLLEGTETLSDVQNLIKELQEVEKSMKEGTGKDMTTVISESVGSSSSMLSMNDPWRLLEDDELPNLDELLAGEVDGSLMGVPGLHPDLMEYPSDFTDVMDYMNQYLVSIRYNLLHYVKSVINEEILYNMVPQSYQSQPSQSFDTSAALYGTRGYRKDSFVIERHPECLSNPPVPSTDPPALLYPATPAPIYITPHGVPITLPIISSDSCGMPDKSKEMKNKFRSSNTYSKKSSPFAVSAPRQHPFSINGNASDEEHQDINVNNYNASVRPATRGIHARSPPALNTSYVISSGDNVRGSHGGSNGSIQNISMEELHSMARLQEEALSSGRSLARKDTHVVSQRSSFDDEEGSGSTGKQTWSNDTYSVDQSNPPSETSSEISSPPVAGSYEDVNLPSECLRRSMPNLTPKNLSIVPANCAQLQRDPRYNSDMKLPSSRTRTRVLRNPTPGITLVNCDDPPLQHNQYATITYKASHRSTVRQSNMEALKRAIADEEFSNTQVFGPDLQFQVMNEPYGQGQETMSVKYNNGAEREHGEMNGYSTYKVRKHPQGVEQSQVPSRMQQPRKYTRNSIGSPCVDGIINPGQRSMIPGPQGGNTRFSLPPSSGIPRRST